LLPGLSAAAAALANYGLVTATGTGAIGIDASADTLGVTLTNAGTIGGSGTGDAVLLGSGDDRLILDPGAAFNGAVDGGAGTNTLELASTSSSGTITGLGVGFLNFQTITVDAGAYWKTDKSDTIASGVVLRNAGTFGQQTPVIIAYVPVAHSRTSPPACWRAPRFTPFPGSPAPSTMPATC
jgi:hypothetical protein